MPRCARVKDSHYTYHIICRSINEIDLFRDNDDKQKYIELLVKYKTMFNFKIYCYCLMDNHLHIMIYSNGADISKIMHGINQSYSQYYNRKYARHGHVFSDRFKSKVVDNPRYMFVLSLYIHNNARSLSKINSIYEYQFSSLAIYVGLRIDKDGLVDPSEVLSRISNDISRARRRYSYQIGRSVSDDDSVDGEILQNIIEYRSEKTTLIPEIDPDYIISYVSQLLSMNGFNIHLKHSKENIEFKSVAIFLMRGLCDMTNRDICSKFGNITQSYVSKLCSAGYKLVNSRYPQLIVNLLSNHNSNLAIDKY